MTKRLFIKHLFSPLLLFCGLYVPAEISAAPLFVYNHGYVLGELNTVDFVGVSRKVITGQVSIGNNSFGFNNTIRHDLPGEYTLNNPWSFCGEQEIYDQLVAHIGQFAVIEYSSPKKSSLLQCPSNNEITGIYPISRDRPENQVRESAKINVASQSYGVSAGRVVNAQKSGKHGDNWSIVVQVGNGGNDFRYLQILDADIYALALNALASATKVKLYHIEQVYGGRRNDRVDTYVWRIETVPGL